MHYITIIGVLLVTLGTIFTIIGQNFKSDEHVNTLTANIQALKDTVIEKNKKISGLEKRMNVINSLEIYVNLDEITRDQAITEKETSAGIQSVVGLFTKDKTRHRFVTDFQFSYQQISKNIRRAMFAYRPEEPTKILGKSIDYLENIEMFSINYANFIDHIEFDRQNENHMLSITILLNGVEVVNLSNLVIQKGQLYSGQLNYNVAESFNSISEKYQAQISQEGV